MPQFPGGALFAVHDDKAVTAFDLREVAQAMHLSQECVD
jgi:3-phytase